MRQFKGRVVTPGTCTAEAVVTTQGFNTLASFQNALQFGDKQVKCGDQNNSDLHGKSMLNKALCLPQTIGSTTGGLVLYCACALKKNPPSAWGLKALWIVDANLLVALEATFAALPVGAKIIGSKYPHWYS